MDCKRVFNQVKGFSWGLLAAPAAIADQFVEPEWPYCDRLGAIIDEIPEAGKAGKAGMITSGVLAFVGSLAFFNYVVSGPMVKKLPQPQAQQVTAPEGAHRPEVANIHAVRRETDRVGPALSAPR